MSHCVRLYKFKAWADEEFGGVRAAFQVLDEDNSGDFNPREFFKMLRFYGFQGDCRTLFLTLDCDGQGSLSLNEVAFLDMWESALPVEEPEQSKASSGISKVKRKVKVSPRLEQLARSRPKLPLVAVASKSSLASEEEGRLSKADLRRSAYGSFYKRGFVTEGASAWRNRRVNVIKQEILRDGIRAREGTTTGDFLLMKKKTIALRNRTMELFESDAALDI